MHALKEENLQAATPISLAATIPPELLIKIVNFVGHEALLSDSDEPNIDEMYFTDRKGGMQHLSACSLTCVYWAKVTRSRMFRIIVLRSTQDINDLLSFFNTPYTQTYARGIPPISYCLRHLIVEHRLGDWVWFHNIQRILKSQVLNQQYTSLQLDVHVSSADSDPPGQDSTYFPAARHPLFRSMPRLLPIPQVSYKSMRLVAKNLRFADTSGLRNLVRDFNLKSAEWYTEKTKDSEWNLERPWRWSTDRIYCDNVRWNGELDTVTQGSLPVLSEGVSCADITTIIIGLDEAEMDGPSVVASGCTDNVIVAFDCLMAVLGSNNRRIQPMKIENYEIVMSLVHGFRGDGVSRSGARHRVDISLEGSWCYKTALLLFELELDFIFTTTRTPTSSIEQLEVPLAVESIRFNTTSQDLLGQAQVHYVQNVYIRLHPQLQVESLGSEALLDPDIYSWAETITTLRRLTRVTCITISCPNRDVVLEFARKMKETLLVIEDMLVLAYFDTVKNESGVVRLEELESDG